MSTRRSSSGSNNNYVGDRHLVKGDRHKKKGIDHHSHRDSGHRCICGYAKCNEVRDGFKGTDSVYDRPPIRLTYPANGGEEWDDFFGSLMRNLHVPEEVEERIRSSSGTRVRFDVCAHHF